MIPSNKRRRIIREWEYFVSLVREGESAQSPDGSVLSIEELLNSIKDEQYANELSERLHRFLFNVPSTHTFKRYVHSEFYTPYKMGLYQVGLINTIANLYVKGDLSAFDSERIEEVELIYLNNLKKENRMRMGADDNFIKDWTAHFEEKYQRK